MKSFVKYGLLTGIFISIWDLSFFFMPGWLLRFLSLGIHPVMILVYEGSFAMLIQFEGMALGIWEAKKSSGDRLTFSAAFRLGILISLVSALTASLFIWLYHSVLPDFTNDMIGEAQRSITAAGKPAREISRQLFGIGQQYNFSGQLVRVLVIQVALGAGGSFALSNLLKTKKPSVLEFM